MLSLWHALPAEMKLAVIDLLEVDQAKTLAYVSREMRQLCASNIFQSVILKSHEDLQGFLHDVPSAYYPFIRSLDVCTRSAGDRSPVDAPAGTRTEAMISLLSHSTHIECLHLRLDGSLAKNVIPCFKDLCFLKALSIYNCGDEINTPISERFVVALAATLPALEDLSLSRISRSELHAPELVGVAPYVPLVTGDADIPPHPLLGEQLYLPSLLRIPTLRKLVIRDTHLGDTRWATTPVACPLEIVDLRSCYSESDDLDRLCTERIIQNVGATIDEFTLNTSFAPEPSASTARPELKKLRKLHLTPLVPVDTVVDTLRTLGGSPIERISVQCLEYDVADVCTALQDFLLLRQDRAGDDFYKHLAEIQVTITEDLDAPVLGGCAIPCAGLGAEAAFKLQEYCRSLGYTSADDEDLDCKVEIGGSVGKIGFEW